MSKKIFDNLFIEKESFAEEVAKEVEGFLRIDRENCTPIFPVSIKKLTIVEKILVELATAYLCFLSGIRKDEAVSRDVLETRCRLAKQVLRARLSDLRKAGTISSMDSGEVLTTQGIIEFRDLIIRLKENKNIS